MPILLIAFSAIAVPFGAFAQQTGTMVIHHDQTVQKLSTADVDSLVFFLNQGETLPPIIVFTRVISRVDTIFVRETLPYQPNNELLARYAEHLGDASFATDSIWTISGNGITQIWSDAVQTDFCSHKTTFKGGSLDGNVWTFHVDCRSNPGFPGDLFSWQAVYTLRDFLCPYPWRVPTMQDFVDLDMALGGNGRGRGDRPQFVTENYINRWGGVFGGGSGSTGSLWHQGSWGDYWSISGHDEEIESAYSLLFSRLGTVNPRELDGKHDGLPLRCIRSSNNLENN